MRSPRPQGRFDDYQHNEEKYGQNSSGVRNGTGPYGQDVPGAQELSWRQKAARQHHGPADGTSPIGPEGVSNGIGNDRNTYARPAPRSRQLYQPNPRPNPRPPPPAIFIAQCEYLDRSATIEVARAQMSYEEYNAKETYRDTLERGFRLTLQQLGLPGSEIMGLKGFGSFSSGFATANSDVDLAVVLRQLPGQTAEQFSQLTKEMPRLLEKALLDAGFGARLLDRTRVPIIKTCQAPTPQLLAALREERAKWDALPDDEKYATKAVKENNDSVEPDASVEEHHDQTKSQRNNKTTLDFTGSTLDTIAPRDVPTATTLGNLQAKEVGQEKTQVHNEATVASQDAQDEAKTRQRPKQKHWLREKPQGPLDFPKEGVGIQADINFSNALALHNTEMLRCYSLCDPRVQPMVLFVKAWAKRRKINSSYNGTLSSYGYVLMVLHFLINITQPPVLPNLQLMQPTMPQGPSLQWQPLAEPGVFCDGYNVNFWREPELIKQLASRGLLTQNQEPLGVLLRNFFHHFAHQGNMVIGRGFQWTSEVLSLRTSGGLLTKEEKGWTGAKTTTTDNVS